MKIKTVNKQIRRGVFETNSSSTHSVSIYKRSSTDNQIPKNSEITIKTDYERGTFYSEVDKLNFIVIMLASIVEHKCDYEDLEIKSFDEMINLSWFKWLADVVKEESSTEVIYKVPTYWNGKEKTYVPYYDTTYDEDDSIEEIFTNYELTILYDEAKFKEHVKDLIYNPAIVMEDHEEEY